MLDTLKTNKDSKLNIEGIGLGLQWWYINGSEIKINATDVKVHLT